MKSYHSVIEYRQRGAQDDQQQAVHDNSHGGCGCCFQEKGGGDFHPFISHGWRAAVIENCIQVNAIKFPGLYIIMISQYRRI